MKEKNYLLFHIAATAAFAISSGILSWFTYDMVFNKSWTRKDWLFPLLFFFFFGSGILFQLANLRLTSFLKKSDGPSIWFKHWHLLLLLINVVGVALLLWGIYEITHETLHDHEHWNVRQTCIYIGLVALILATIFTIVSSLRLRTLLALCQNQREEQWLEQLGK